MSVRATIGQSLYFTGSFRATGIVDQFTLDKLKHIQIQRFTPVLCWVEKVLLLIDCFQLFGILWVAAQPWPWPYLFTTYTRPFLYFAFDFFSLMPDGALAGRSTSTEIPQWGMMDNYPIYAVIFALFQFLAFSVFLVAYYRPNFYGIRMHLQRDKIIAVSLLISYILYLPCSLATFRLYYCETDPEVLSADPSVACLGGLHLTTLTVCTIFTMPAFIGLPIIFYYYAIDNIIYDSNYDHEKRIQMWEIFYFLDIDDYWLTHQVWIISSFIKFGSLFRHHMLFLKAFLLIVFIFVRSDFPTQAFLYFSAITVFTTYYAVHKYPYRTFTSNGILVLLGSSMMVDSGFALANAFSVRSAVMVGSNASLTMLIYKFFCFLGVFMLLIFTLVGSNVLDWPSLQTMFRIWHNPALIPNVATWVETIREINNFKYSFVLSPMEIADIHLLEDYIRQLRKCWLAARSCGSIFETPIGELLEELLILHSNRIKFSLRKHDYWDKAYLDTVGSNIFPNRERRYAVMAPKKRRILTKLLAYRFIRGDRGKFDMDIAEEEIKKQEKMVELKAAKKNKGKKTEEEKIPLLQKKLTKRFNFSRFTQNAKKYFLAKEAKEKGEDLTTNETQEKLEDDLEKNMSELQLEDEELEVEGGFSAAEIEEAAQMIERLRERTELALNKFHHAKQKLKEAQKNAAMNSAQENQNNNSMLSMGISKINTMDLIRETVDTDEQNDLEELYLLWDEAIQLYEMEQFPGDYEKLNMTVENWYTYRGLVTERLELVVGFLHDQDLDSLIENSLIEEEGESDEESVFKIRKNNQDEESLL